ncbi:hypothetical protein B0E46_02665 [Rhodanobacter sp. B04]|uniref:hypothetical protein n=1 Tax=Rhodanobacter sp. B04 TaxID=1945860 RepID=UPI0009873574|nr:hypothetical protein [Rhodanobacter sp. B04]OOG66388.1 hypothetical protein B0E46_02665 [Rhodanobacter sp. B04]
MTSGWVTLGTLGQLALAGFQFMLVIVSASSLGAGPALGKLESATLNALIYVLPATSIASAAIVLYLYRHGGSSAGYWWYALPLAATLGYLVYVVGLSHRS